jgi:BirA family biotin operon repressor/biotin-[acetyl-CoA-carboxylase] ligase
MHVHRIHLATVDSTNSYAKREAGTFGARDLTVITASEQTAGRGRGERSWVSRGEDDIKVTFAFQVPLVHLPKAYLLSPLLSVTTRRALSSRGIGGSSIKWPNDLLFGGCRKVGGILCEMEGPMGGSAGGAFFAALGVGLNVNSLPQALGVTRPVWPLSTLRAEAGGEPLDVPGLLESMVAEFALALPLFFAQGFAPFRQEYEAGSALLGKVVRMTHSEEGVVQGRAVGIGEDGKLLLEGAGGAIRGVLSGEVSGIELVVGEGEEGGDGGEGRKMIQADFSSDKQQQ